MTNSGDWHITYETRGCSASWPKLYAGALYGKKQGIGVAVKNDLIILISQAMVVYFLVLWAHSLRHRVGLAHFYALIGGITAIMSWVTDAGVRVQVSGVTFMVGSTVFYTSLLLGVFAVYIFDGPRATRIAISTIAGVSVMVPLIAAVLHLQMRVTGNEPLAYVPVPDLRINASSVFTTVADLIFLAVAWEYLGKTKLRVRLWLRSYITLLGVMWLDVLLFATGAFLGKPEYLNIMKGTLLSRLVISVFAFPFFYLYLNWQNRKVGAVIQDRPILAILREVAEIKMELSLAQQEIERRKEAERKNEELIAQLQQALVEVKTLRGFLPICANCKKIRNDAGYWEDVEIYMRKHTQAEFSHGICPECVQKLYPGFSGKKDPERTK